MSDQDDPSVANTWVYRLPDQLSDGFCHHGGTPIMFLNVDWFHVPRDLPREELVAFLRGKKYFDETQRYLVLGGPQTFTIEPAAKLKRESAGAR